MTVKDLLRRLRKLPLGAAVAILNERQAGNAGLQIIDGDGDEVGFIEIEDPAQAGIESEA